MNRKPVCGGFGREPARRCVERASLPVALILAMVTWWREAWVPAAEAVNNKHSILVPCSQKSGRGVDGKVPVQGQDPTRELLDFTFPEWQVCLSLGFT